MGTPAPTSKIFGRDEELATIDAFLAATRAGFGALALEGTSGIGKTTIWEEAVRRAGAGGAAVFVARPVKAEAGLSFAALSDMLAPAALALSQLPEPQRQALGAALLHGPAPAGLDERAVCAAVVTLLRVLARDRPLVVAVDDAHLLDAPSARALSYAARRLTVEPIGFVASVTVHRGRPATFVHAGAPERSLVMTLGPLAAPALYDLIRRRVPHPLSRATVIRVAEVSGGNPLYALEMARALARPRSVDDPAAAPAGLSDLVAASVRRLPLATRRALLLVASLAQPTVDVVDTRALAEAEDAGIVTVDMGRIRFCHPLFASTVYRQAGAATRRAVHRHLAALVADPEERARHLALGSERPDEAIARQLDDAAMVAGSRGAADGAADLAELALRLTPGAAGAERVDRVLAAARFHVDAGDFARAQALLEEAVAGAPNRRLRAQALQLLGQVHGRRNNFTEAMASAEAALRAGEEDPGFRAGVLLDIAFCRTSLGDFLGAEGPARAALADAESSGVERFMAGPLAVLTVVEFLSGRGLDEYRLARALMLEDPDAGGPMITRPRFIHGLILVWTGRPDEAIATLDELRAETLERGRESAVALVLFYLVWAYVWQGDLARAAALAQESRRTAILLDDPAAAALALSACALVHAHDGSTEHARAEAAEAVALFERLQWRSGTIWPLWALGVAELSVGNPAAAHAALGPLAEVFAGMARSDPVLGVFLPDEVEALVALGRWREAEQLLTVFEERAAAADRPWALAAAERCRGLLHAARGELAAAVVAFDCAQGQHDRTGMPFEKARTLFARGLVLRRLKRRAQSREVLNEALALFLHAGAPRWADRAQAELRRTGSRAASGDDLTATELAVAELAASGLSNREIAARAFLTAKGVEANLTRVYRKLGIRSRAGVANALRRRTGGDEVRRLAKDRDSPISPAPPPVYRR